MSKESWVSMETKALKQAASELKAIAEADDSNSSDFNQKRLECNLHAIQALTGSEISQNKKGDTQIKFNHHLPSTAEVGDIADVMDRIEKDIERPWINKNFTTSPEPDSMEIPDVTYDPIPTLDKPRNKSLKDYLYDQQTGICSQSLTAADCIKIAAYGKEARFHHNLKWGLIIGGISIAVIGGVTVGILCYNHKKKHDHDDEDETEEADVDIVEDDADIDVSLDTTPPPVELSGFAVSGLLDYQSLGTSNLLA